MAYTLSNKCTKNCCKRTILVQDMIAEDVVACFLEHSVISVNGASVTLVQLPGNPYLTALSSPLRLIDLKNLIKTRLFHLAF